MNNRRRRLSPQAIAYLELMCNEGQLDERVMDYVRGAVSGATRGAFKGGAAGAVGGSVVGPVGTLGGMGIGAAGGAILGGIRGALQTGVENFLGYRHLLTAKETIEKSKEVALRTATPEEAPIITKAYDYALNAVQQSIDYLIGKLGKDGRKLRPQAQPAQAARRNRPPVRSSADDYFANLS